jgi:integrase
LLGTKAARDLNAHDLAAVIAEWRRHGYAKGTLYQMRGVLRRAVRYFEHQCGTQPGTSDLIERVAVPPIRTVTATDEERHKLLTAAPDYLRLFTLLCADLGMRKTTALRFQLDTYDKTAKQITFTTKGGVQQTLPVTRELADFFASLPEWLPTAEPLIAMLRLPHVRRGLWQRHGQGKQPYHYVQKEWNTLKRVAGVRMELRIHDLRRSGAEGIYRVTKDVRAVQAFLGHQSVATTARYLGQVVSADQLREPIAAAAALKDKARKQQE